MSKLSITIFFLFLFFELFSQHKVRVEIKDIPPDHPNESSVFLAGSFNSWNPADEKYKFTKESNGSYFLVSTLQPGSYEYKITRGGWDKVECDRSGANIANRVLKIDGDAVIEISVEGWIDFYNSGSKRSTANPNVQIIDTAFFIPQLQRHRRVWVYLPENYERTKKKYPVLYMHDGQNVFDDATSFAGEWGVDECLDTMLRKCIVVAIDNDGVKRLNEYSPYDFSLTGIASSTVSGNGEGKSYVEFIAETLKPYIDKKYRTLRKKNETWIAGSSMGGLISLYAVLKYPKIFGGAGVFSPAFWVAPDIFKEINSRGKKVKGKIYFFAGKQEGERMVPDILKAFEKMTAVSKSKMTMVIRDDGKHNEPTWRKEFPLFYKWVSD